MKAWTKTLLLTMAGIGVAPAEPQFEVSAVKVNKSGQQGFKGFKLSHGSFTVENVSLKMLIEDAYRVQGAQITGGPAWLQSEKYDITAKGDPNASNSQIWQMVQALLADRFKLVFHRETKELPIYALVTAKNGSKLRKAKDVDCAAAPPPPPGPGISLNFCGEVTSVYGPQGEYRWGSNVPISDLAGALSAALERPVVDRTGLNGTFDFQLQWTPEGYKFTRNENERESQRPNPDAQGPSLFSAVQEQLGLKLESTKGPVEILVIDRAQKPSEN